MIITRELVLSLYKFAEKEIYEKFDYLDEITKKLNISTEEFISQIKEIVTKKLYLAKKDKDLDVDENFLKIIFNLFLNQYTICDELRKRLQYYEEDLDKINTIELKDYYISSSSSHLKLYKKDDFVKKDNFFSGVKIYINLYEMHINFDEPENDINDMLGISDNLVIVLFINLMFLFNIENNIFNVIKYIKENYKLLKCSKYDKTKIMIGSEKNLLIYEILDNFILQKITIIELGNIYRKNYYFFNKIIVVDDNETIQLFSINKNFKVKKIKKDYIIKNNLRIKICYIKKINMFVLLENCLTIKKLILTDFIKVYDEIKISYKANYIQEFSQTDEFLLLFFESLSKYKIENNKFKLIFTVKIDKNGKFPIGHDHIMQISYDLYFITGMNGYLIYKYDKKDEINSNAN